MADVTIIGGGVIGLSIADELARAGTAVRILDQAGFGTEASWAGAGMLPPGNLANAATPDARLRSLSHDLWPDTALRLERETGIDIGYCVSGAVRLFDRADERDAELVGWRDEGVRAESLTPAILSGIEPHLAAARRPSLLLPDQAQVRNPRLLKALIASCAAHGVELIPNCPLVEWRTEGYRVTGLRTPVGDFASDRYCLAAGAWSRRLLEPLGFVLPVRPVRGQIVLLNVDPLPIARMIEAGQRYLVPRPDGRVLVGATEEDAGFEKRNTAAAVGGLLAMAIELCPTLGGATIERTWSGLRPGSPDGVPSLGRVPGFDNLFVAAGHFRSGLQMSPGTGRIMRQLLRDEPSEIPLDGLEPNRHSPTAEVR